MSSQASEPVLVPSQVFDRSASESIATTALSPGQLAWRRFKRHKMAMGGSVGLTLIILFIIVGSLFYSEKDANRVDVVRRLTPPSSENFFGTDSTGRDLFARIIYGGQISLFIGVLAVTLALIIGVTIGGVAGYLGGWVDSILMRFTEAALSIPSLFLLIVLGKLFGSEIPTMKFLDRTFSGSVIVVILVIGIVVDLAFFGLAVLGVEHQAVARLQAGRTIGKWQAAAEAGTQVEGDQRLAQAGVALEQGEVVGAEVEGPQPGGGPGQEVAGALEGGAGDGEGGVHGGPSSGLGPATAL